jgi:hypothetical protein
VVADNAFPNASAIAVSQASIAFALNHDFLSYWRKLNSPVSLLGSKYLRHVKIIS